MVTPRWQQPNWDPSDLALHKTIKRYRGRAKNYDCIDCSEKACDWSWRHDTNRLDIYNYDPRCRRCHFLYDGRDNFRSPWNEPDYRERMRAAHKERWAERIASDPEAGRKATENARAETERLIRENPGFLPARNSAVSAGRMRHGQQ